MSLPESLGPTLVRNAIVGGGARAVTLAVGLVMTPYVLARLGGPRFGILALATVLTGVAGIFDFSLKSSLVKFLAELEARDDEEARARIVATSVAFYSVVGGTAFGLFLLLKPLVLDVLRIPPDLREETAFVFLIALGELALSGILAVFPALCDARQRIDLTNALGIACLLGSTAATIFALESGAGLRGVILARFGGVAAFHLAAVVLARRLVGWSALPVRRPSGSWFRRMFFFGLKLHISSTCAIVNRQLDKFLLGRWVGLSWVASYEIGYRVASNAGSFQPFLAAALLPAASGLEAAGQRDRLVTMYERASRTLFLVGIPPFALIFATAPALVTTWLGHPDPLAAGVLRLLSAGVLVNSSSTAMANVCQGIGRPDIQAWQSALQLLTNIVASVALFRLIGPMGPPLGTSLALIVGAAIFAVSFHPVLGTTTARVLSTAAKPAAVSAAAAASGWCATLSLVAHNRTEGALNLVAAGAVFSAVLVVGCRLAGRPDREELALLRSVLARLRERSSKS